MYVGGDVDNARRDVVTRGWLERRQQQLSEQEMAQVVYLEVHFITVTCVRLRDEHATGWRATGDGKLSLRHRHKKCGWGRDSFYERYLGELLTVVDQDANGRLQGLHFLGKLSDRIEDWQVQEEALHAPSRLGLFRPLGELLLHLLRIQHTCEYPSPLFLVTSTVWPLWEKLKPKQVTNLLYLPVTTLTPFEASFLTISSPMPELPPVTTAKVPTYFFGTPVDGCWSMNYGEHEFGQVPTRTVSWRTWQRNFVAEKLLQVQHSTEEVEVYVVHAQPREITERNQHRHCSILWLARQRSWEPWRRWCGNYRDVWHFWTRNNSTLTIE